jgi:hypothetical protein
MYVVLAAGCVLAFMLWGWVPAVALVVWAFAGSALLDFVWPFPTRSQSAGMVQREISGGVARLVVTGQTSSSSFAAYYRLMGAAGR